MENIFLIYPHGKKFVYLFPEKDHLRVRVCVSGVRGIPGERPKTVSEQTHDWKQVLEALHVPVKTTGKSWELFG